MTNEQRQDVIARLRREIQGLWRPADLLLAYVQKRLMQLATLGEGDPSPQRSCAPAVAAVTDATFVLSQRAAQVEGEPA